MTSSFRKTVQKLAEQNAGPFERMTYRCKAHGCPNVGSMNVRQDVSDSGVCAWHFRESDPLRWDETTRRILSDETMRDGYVRPSFGQQGFKDTPTQAAMRAALKKRRPAEELP